MKGVTGFEAVKSAWWSEVPRAWWLSIKRQGHCGLAAAAMAPPSHKTADVSQESKGIENTKDLVGSIMKRHCYLKNDHSLRSSRKKIIFWKIVMFNLSYSWVTSNYTICIQLRLNYIQEEFFEFSFMIIILQILTWFYVQRLMHKVNGNESVISSPFISIFWIAIFSLPHNTKLPNTNYMWAT